MYWWHFVYVTSPTVQVKAHAQQMKEEAAAAKAAEQGPAGAPVVASASNGSPNGFAPSPKKQPVAGSGSSSNGTDGSGAGTTNGTSGSGASTANGSTSANGVHAPPDLRSAARFASNGGGGTAVGSGAGTVQQPDASQQPTAGGPKRKAKRSTCSRCGSPDHQVRCCCVDAVGECRAHSALHTGWSFASYFGSVWWHLAINGE